MSSQPSALITQLRAKRGGFALLITVTLLAFIVILLVGLAAYTRVETAIAGNTQRQAQARENALLALNVALGQLQKYAGPDQRVTATAEKLPNGTGTSRYTGVWDATTTDATPLTWLVSGNELNDADGNPAPLAITPATSVNATTGTALVGTNTSRTANDVLARVMPITTTGVPGVPGTAPVTIGRYAWWVGDQGVKAPVAVADSSASVNFAPYDSAELQSRIRQQIGLGAGAASATDGAAIFEPRDNNNASLVANQKVTATAQLPFLRNASNAQIGLTRVQQNFHAWSPNNFAVIANSKDGGLRQDLSLDPSLLGSAFTAWANYDPARGGYMESLVATPVEPTEAGGDTTTSTPAHPIQPAYGSDPVRRRYAITPPTESQGVVFSVAPVLSFFGLSFSVRENSDDAPQMEVAVRCVMSLWNPYASGLVPEDLKVEVTGLPRVRVDDSAGGSHAFNLMAVMAGARDAPLKFSLPWTDDGTQPDRGSWLPGRVYSWAATGNTAEPEGGNPMIAHAPDATPDGAGSGIVRPAGIHHHNPTPTGGASTTTEVTRSCEVTEPTTLHIRVLRARDDTEIASYDTVVFPSFVTSPLPVTNKYVDFAFISRLPQGDELPADGTEKWLAAAGRDPRAAKFPSNGFIAGPKGDDPGAYGGDKIIGFVVRDEDRLLDRAGNSYSYNEDVPVFELPRAPLLSLGQLQHLQMLGLRPFAIGNSWGGAAQINGIAAGQLFDRFFFSGLVDGITPATASNGDLILPNPLLKPLRQPDSKKVTIDDVRALMTPPQTTDPDGNVISRPPSAYSSKFFLQGGAFNVNSVNAAAWAAVLRSVRFPSPQSFTYLDSSLDTGTAADDAKLSVSSTDAQFFRFSQSAQETYKAEAGQSAPGGTTTTPPNTHLFRQGMRTLSATQLKDLAAKIVGLIATKHASSEAGGGPFRSLEEFLAPSALFAGIDSAGVAGAPRSLLEAAIAEAGINTDIPEFSSQWLTQADIMTALAPVLYARSDTFIIRTYGEAMNPATTAVEGRAWCEAIVQRVPDYVDPTDPPETLAAAFATPSDPNDAASAPTKAHQLNKQLGRRFKVVSFRWLTRSDI